MPCPFRLVPVLVSLLIAGRQSNGQDIQAALNADVSASVQSLVKMHQAWGAKASTPNTSLAIKEISHDGQVFKFRLYGKGLSKDAVFSLMSWPVNQKSPGQSLPGVMLDESGMAICAGKPGTCGSPDTPNDPIDLIFQPIPGEPFRVGLFSPDGVKVLAKVVPLPLRGEDGGCTVEATLLTPGAEAVLIEGAGFPANGDLVMDSSSEGERHRENAKAGADGEYVTAIMPYKQGFASGTLRVKLKSKKCSPSVEVPWGGVDHYFDPNVPRTETPAPKSSPPSGPPRGSCNFGSGRFIFMVKYGPMDACRPSGKYSHCKIGSSGPKSNVKWSAMESKSYRVPIPGALPAAI
jgi:hypothetical protein